MTKLTKLSEKHTIRFTKKQMNSLYILEKYNVNISKFIRAAIKEKIKKDWSSIKKEFEIKEKDDCPF